MPKPLSIAALSSTNQCFTEKMKKLQIIRGNIFTTSCQTVVNTVNCVGVMGAGLALEFRLRYPAMFEQYVKLCESKLLDVGKLWLYKTQERWVLNFPTKKHWRFPSKERYVRIGLEKFLQTYEAKGIESVAFPLLGAQHGGLGHDKSLAIMQDYLQRCSIPVEIYQYDPNSTDDLYFDFKAKFQTATVQEIKVATGLRSNSIGLIKDALESPRVCQLNQLAAFKGIGDKTLEKAFSFMRDENKMMMQTQLL